MKYLNFQDPKKPGSIDWCTHTHNAMTGCLHDCPYCSARKKMENSFFKKAFPHGFEPHYYPERLDAPLNLRDPAVIFEGNITDYFGYWVDEKIINALFSMMYCAKQHQFFLLTKNPKRMYDVLAQYPMAAEDHQNVWLGTSIDGVDPIVSEQRHTWIHGVASDLGWNTFISYEPLLGEFKLPAKYDAKWVIIGSQTNPVWRSPFEQVSKIVFQAVKDKVPIFLKKTLKCVPDKTPLAIFTPERILHPRFPPEIEPIMKAWGKK